MFVIYGWGRQTKKDFGPVHPFHCQHCNNDSYWMMLRRKVWFTLFFIPIIPYESHYALMCPICSWGIELRGKQIATAMQLGTVTKAYLNKQITEDQYKL